TMRTMISGKAGSESRFLVRRGDLTFERSLERRESQVFSQLTNWKGQKLGYTAISNFDPKTPGLFAAHLRALDAKGAQGLVLDLRNNSGGRLEPTVVIAQILLGGAVPAGYVYADPWNPGKSAPPIVRKSSVPNPIKWRYDKPVVIL